MIVYGFSLGTIVVLTLNFEYAELMVETLILGESEMHTKRYVRKIRREFLFLPFFLTICACSTFGDVPTALRVEEGAEPEFQDEQVRFRTTYYFRIVDSCRVEDGLVTEMGEDGATKENDSYLAHLGLFQGRNRGLLRIVNDSFYRFRMTGKASALFAKIHFESGILRAEQIDPFGSSVKFNQNEGVFQVESASTFRERARREEIRKEIISLKNLIHDGDGIHEELVKEQIKQQIKLLGLENESHSINPQLSKSNNLTCPDGRPTRKSYLLYGPEGVRELDPDERLLMAMTSDSKPLISMLQQLSEKNVQAQTTQVSDFTRLLAERILISDSLKDVKSISVKKDKNVNDIVELIKTIRKRLVTNLDN